MTKRIAKFMTVVGGCAALAVGGSAVAGAAQSHAPAAKAAVKAEPVGGPDTDSIQSGDQTTPDTAPVAAKAKSTAKSTATEAPGTEQSPSSEAAGEQPGSETAADSDGPGGHADEPGNANADHQFEGVE
jgi:hypothetical protein